MTEKLNTIAACKVLERGLPVFGSEVTDITRGILNGMTANGETVKCSHRGSEWWIKWTQGSSESIWDKAAQMSKAIATTP